MIRHDIAVDLTPTMLGGSDKMYVDVEHMSFEWNKEKLYLQIEKLNEEDMEQLEIFELNSNVPDKALELSSAKRKRQVKSESGIPLNEWRK
jgi:hypothetical protein